MDGTCLGHLWRLEDLELIVSVLLVDEIGLPISSRSCRAWSIAFISFVVLWIVESDTGPRAASEREEGLGGAAPGMN